MNQEFPRLSRQSDHVGDTEEFARLAAFLLRHRGNFSEAIMAVEADGPGKLERVRGLTVRLVDILRATKGESISRSSMTKAAVGSVPITGSPFQNLSAISSAFVASLQSFGAFDRMLPFMAPVPTLAGGTVGAVNISATSYSVLEGQLKPISKLSLSGALATPQKCHIALIVTNELARMTNAVRLIQTELRNSIAVAADSVFINSIIAGVIPANSFGTSASNARADIEYLLRQINVKQTSAPFLVTTPAIARTLSQKENNGAPAFPMLGPMGGEVSPGLPLLVSDAVPLGYLIAVDASRIAANGGEVELSQIEEGTLQLDDSPDSPPTGTTSLTSLWQMNLTGIRVERFMLCQKLTSSAVAIINQPNSYIVGAGSP